MNQTEQLKRCPVCKTDKPHSAFSPNKRSKDKLNYQCKACHSAKEAQRQRDYRASKGKPAQGKPAPAPAPQPQAGPALVEQLQSPRMLWPAGVGILSSAIIAIDPISKPGRVEVVTSGLSFVPATREHPACYVESLKYDFSTDEAAPVLSHFYGSATPPPDQKELDALREQLDQLQTQVADLTALAQLGLERHKAALGGVDCPCDWCRTAREVAHG